MPRRKKDQLPAEAETELQEELETVEEAPVQRRRRGQEAAEPGHPQMDAGRRAALDKALGDLLKRFGDGAIMRLGEAQHMNVEAIPTGSLALDLALGIVSDLGWNVVASDKQSGRIEAVDTTFWFGFKDDVVVRLRGTANSTRIDVRSKSRVGVGDVGTNARRVRELLRRLQSAA